MALQIKTVALAEASSATFVFTKPLLTYGKTAGFTASSGEGSNAWFSADVDNGDGTMTGTINFGGPVSGTAEIWILDKP